MLGCNNGEGFVWMLKDNNDAGRYHASGTYNHRWEDGVGRIE